jgi:hypothetical protein
VLALTEDKAAIEAHHGTVAYRRKAVRVVDHIPVWDL